MKKKRDAFHQGSWGIGFKGPDGCFVMNLIRKDKKMRKRELLILSLAVGLALCGCEKREVEAKQEEKEKEMVR